MLMSLNANGFLLNYNYCLAYQLSQLYVRCSVERYMDLTASMAAANVLDQHQPIFPGQWIIYISHVVFEIIDKAMQPLIGVLKPIISVFYRRRQELFFFFFFDDINMCILIKTISCAETLFFAIFQFYMKWYIKQWIISTRKWCTWMQELLLVINVPISRLALLTKRQAIGLNKDNQQTRFPLRWGVYWFPSVLQRHLVENCLYFVHTTTAMPLSNFGIWVWVTCFDRLYAERYFIT